MALFSVRERRATSGHSIEIADTPIFVESACGMARFYLDGQTMFHLSLAYIGTHWPGDDCGHLFLSREYP